jgi:hypothetical protein
MNKKRFRRKNQTVYESRKLMEYYKVADVVAGMKVLPTIIKCTYDGKTSAILRNKTISLKMPDYTMPFHKLARQVTVMASAGSKLHAEARTP